jgi:hypothetical protein
MYSLADIIEINRAVAAVKSRRAAPAAIRRALKRKLAADTRTREGLNRAAAYRASLGN